MASLFDLLSQQTPTLQVRKGLMILDLQNDFLSPAGKLKVWSTGFLEPLSKFARSFREFGDVIWVRSQFESMRPIGGPEGCNVLAGGSSGKEVEMQSTDDAETHKTTSKTSKSATAAQDNEENDEELFLSRTSDREPCCTCGSHGAEYYPDILPLIREGEDLQMIKTHYSAFSSTSLLLTLRRKLITELYICGCITNLSVYATAMDAARYGIRVTLVEDCLGYRRQEKHDLAIEQLKEFMEASATSSTRILQVLRGLPDDEAYQKMAVGRASQLQDDANALEVDSDDSDEDDEEVNPIPLRLFDRRVESRFARPSSKYSPRILAEMQQRKASSEHAQPSNSHRGNTEEPPAQATSGHQIHRSGQQRNFQPASKSDSSRRYGSELRSHNSSYRQPWLDLIPPEPPVDTSRIKHPALAAIANAAALSPSSIAEIEEMMQRVRMEDSQTRTDAMMDKPLFGDDKEKESAGSRMVHHLLPPHFAETVFDEMSEEVDWQKMYHLVGEVPRLVCCQGTMGDDDSMPIYRHPSDHTIPLQKWTKTVDRVRKAAEKAVGHSLNHVLIQLYRSGHDFISEHSDKTLDISPSSKIVNVSFGAQRTMRLRTKRGATTSEPSGARITYRVPMPHNSMIIMSLKTNAQYLHGINADKRPRCELVEDEKAFDGQRISCTFRQIGTFINKDEDLIWGQGAVGKRREDAREVVNGDVAESEKLVRAFGAENAASTIEWQNIYGQGFDVLHLKAIQGIRETLAVTLKNPQ